MQGLVESGPVILEKKIKDHVKVISLFCNYLGKGHDHSFEETLILFTKWCFVPYWVEISIVVLKKKIFNLVILRFRWAKKKTDTWSYSYTCLMATSIQQPPGPSGQFQSCLFIFSQFFNWLSGQLSNMARSVFSVLSHDLSKESNIRSGASNKTNLVCTSNYTSICPSLCTCNDFT